MSVLGMHLLAYSNNADAGYSGYMSNIVLYLVQTALVPVWLPK